jgi:hypothetical protein
MRTGFGRTHLTTVGLVAGRCSSHLTVANSDAPILGILENARICH